jgi:hypothetical protein
MPKHHIIQEKYLEQWVAPSTKNQLHIYSIPENRYMERGPGWKGFWRKDFNVLDQEENDRYLPEKVTALVDEKGLEAIKKINYINYQQLSGEDRSGISFYVVLQYIRTPRHREELDKALSEQIKMLMKSDISSQDKVQITKEDILSCEPINDKEKQAQEEASLMSEEEIKSLVFNSIQNEDFEFRLNNIGHSKEMMKLLESSSRELFETEWTFLIAPPDTSFITSDNPCFTISQSKIWTGLLSPLSRIIFPLRPDICVYIKKGTKSRKENYEKLNKKQVKSINKDIVANSYQCIVAKDEKHLRSLLKGFDYKNHRKSRDVVIYKNGEYTMFNIE